jgi:extracellular factor (EF) 3-hydroxypalmitic acid methyl ester biosynthesis protein
MHTNNTQALIEPSAAGTWSPGYELAEVAQRLGRLSLDGSEDGSYHGIMMSVHRLLRAAHAAEDLGMSIDDMRERTAPARVASGQLSTILAHTQRWPRGYAGDFELIERLLDATPGGDPGSLGNLLDRIVLNLPVVEQHRAKVAWQAGVVRARLRAAAPVRVLSMACGGSRDLMLLEPEQLARLTVVLNDLDADALALSRARLEGKVRQLVCVQGNVLRRSNQLRALGPFDAILVGGLLDYVPERAARALMLHAMAMLAPSGVLAATNIATGNPWRLFLELLAGWKLIHRQERDMRALLESEDGRCEVACDHTGLTWLGTTTRWPVP